MANYFVNLDAMIQRADLAQTSEAEVHFDNISTISLRDFTNEGTVGRMLRKPDFQRETNHWSPSQVVSLLQCYLNGDLIPSIILWQSATYLFVIDGGHRLSVLRSWIEDDYGDGPRSREFFGDSISNTQKVAAEKTRRLIADSVGTYQHFKSNVDAGKLDSQTASFSTRGLHLQWVKGNVGKAEDSFFRINTQGTALDSIEEALLRYRRRPIAISARAVIRAGMGHKYWSIFDATTTPKIEAAAKDLHKTLFDPEISSPIKTLDLPLGGAKGVRAALQVLIDYFAIANKKSDNKEIGVDFGSDDVDGQLTIDVLKRALELTKRITGNNDGSLGLHPAVYFYGPTGVHSVPMFLGTAALFAEKMANNDSNFFRTFSLNREAIEQTLIKYKDLIATVLQKTYSKRRVNNYRLMLNEIVLAAKNKIKPSAKDIVKWGGITGEIIKGEEKVEGAEFSDETKSLTFIQTALKTTPKCPICKGYLDTNKSVSYDHIVPKVAGGNGDPKNCQITHPYCNQAIKGGMDLVLTAILP